MTLVWRSVDVVPPAATNRGPQARGWTCAAIAVHSTMTMSSPMLLRLEADDLAAITIDFRHHAFEWALAIDRFPDDPECVVVETEPTTASAMPIFSLPGRGLDSLLWEIGRHAFAGMPASWLRPYDRYKLTRWPSLNEHVPTRAEMRMTAMLGNVFLTAPELAAAAAVDEIAAQSLLNAFSLMGILESSSALPAAPVVHRRAIEAAA